MPKTVIRVENLSKRYRIGLKEKQSETLAGQIGNMIKSPWYNFKRLREMSKFGVEDESVFWALKDLNFEVKEGEVLGIIGKNGAGKSTLLKILSGITDPTSGRIEIHGRVASLLEVGTGFHPELSGRENIYMNGTILGMSRKEIDSKLDEIIDFSGVEKFIDTPVKFYSSGMKVRLGFSVAAHLEPEILIIDEVLAVGDYEFQKKCLGKMENVAGQGKTVLFVSHNMGAVKNLTKNSILLCGGCLEKYDDTSTIVNDYLRGEAINPSKSFDSKSHFVSIISNYSFNQTFFSLKENLGFKIKLNDNLEMPRMFRFGITISSIDDVNLISGVSNEIDQLPLSNSDLLLEIRSPGLVEGDYKLSISIGLGSLYEVRKEFEVCKDALFFSVVNSSKDGPSLINWYSSYGAIIKDSCDVNLIYSNG